MTNFRMDGATAVVTVKAPTERHAWSRVLNLADKGKAPAFYEMRVVQVAPPNAAGNATFECRMLVGRDDPFLAKMGVQ